MEDILNLLARQYLLTQDPLIAVKFVETYLQLVKNEEPEIWVCDTFYVDSPNGSEAQIGDIHLFYSKEDALLWASDWCQEYSQHDNDLISMMANAKEIKDFNLLHHLINQFNESIQQSTINVYPLSIETYE